MPNEGSITRLIAELKSGNSGAVAPLWEVYFPRLVALARGKLMNAPRRSEEEDVALSAFHSFYVRATAGQFPRLDDRHSLWPLLVVITARKCANLFRRESRKKRQQPSEPIDLTTILSEEPTPEFAAQAVDELDHLLRRLDATGDAELRNIALWKLEGLTTEEIAERLGCVRRTVERKSQLIVRVWQREE